MPTLGIIGSGNIGSAVARLAVAADMNVVIANSRGPQSLQELIAELGPLAKAGTLDDAAKLGDAVVLSIPLKAVPELPERLLRGKLVLDTSNYYPFRDGRIEELLSSTVTTSELVQKTLDGARLVKAFNGRAHSAAGPSRRRRRPLRTAHRRRRHAGQDRGRGDHRPAGL